MKRLLGYVLVAIFAVGAVGVGSLIVRPELLNHVLPKDTSPVASVADLGRAAIPASSGQSKHFVHGYTVTRGSGRSETFYVLETPDGSPAPAASPATASTLTRAPQAATSPVSGDCDSIPDCMRKMATLAEQSGDALPASELHALQAKYRALRNSLVKFEGQPAECRTTADCMRQMAGLIESDPVQSNDPAGLSKIQALYRAQLSLAK